MAKEEAWKPVTATNFKIYNIYIDTYKYIVSATDMILLFYTARVATVLVVVVGYCHQYQAVAVTSTAPSAA